MYLSVCLLASLILKLKKKLTVNFHTEYENPCEICYNMHFHGLFEDPAYAWISGDSLVPK